MDIKDFNIITKDVSFGNSHPNYFVYDGFICELRCRSTRNRVEDYTLVSIENDEYGNPDVVVSLINVDVNELTMLVEQNIKL